MSLFMPSIQEQYATTYRIAQLESGMLCMVCAFDREHALEMIAKAADKYDAKVDIEKMVVTLPNKSTIHYVVPK